MLPFEVRHGQRMDINRLLDNSASLRPSGALVRSEFGNALDSNGDGYGDADQSVMLAMETVMNRAGNSPPPEVAANVSRISIGFFHQPNYDAVIECIPTCAGPDRPARYPPVRSGDYRDIKYQETLVAGEVS